MTTPILNGPAEIGRFYMVPCVKVNLSARSWWIDANGWVPVLGPKHADQEYLQFAQEHWHIDWRFVTDRCFKAAAGGSHHQLGRVLSNDTGDAYHHELTRAPELRRIKCKRAMPDFPIVRKLLAGTYADHKAIRWTRLERAQAFVCNKLKPGNICPHRGIDLTPFIKEDGTVICPGHGLRWDTKTGELIPHHTL